MLKNYRGEIALALASLKPTSGAGQPTVSNPLLEFYRVLSSREVVKPFVGCGFNDVGAPQPGHLM
jgi:hypothetical protein